jgi:DNA-dependent RNA polymerase auxiliary subunit epsilon
MSTKGKFIYPNLRQAPKIKRLLRNNNFNINFVHLVSKACETKQAVVLFNTV